MPSVCGCNPSRSRCGNAPHRVGLPFLDAEGILEGQEHLLRQHETEDEVYKDLFIGVENESMVQELLQLLFQSFASSVQRLLIDHLPGGKHHSVTDPAGLKRRNYFQPQMSAPKETLQF